MNIKVSHLKTTVTPTEKATNNRESKVALVESFKYLTARSYT